jgi:hypothetical protein
MSKEKFFDYFKMPELHNTWLGDRLFRSITTRKKGVITFPDFAQAVTLLSEGDADSRTDLFFKMYASNPEFELISKDDLHRYVSGMLESMS